MSAEKAYTDQNNIMQFPVKSRYKADTAEILLKGREGLKDAAAWVNDLRSAAASSVAEYGLPTPKLERYKYANLPAALKKLDLGFIQADIAVEGPSEYVQTMDQVLVDTPDWVKDLLTEAPAGEAQYEDMMLWHGANAFLRDGLVIDIPVDKSVDEPIQITFSGEDKKSFVPRMVVRVQAGSELTILEQHQGDGAFWNNALTQIIVEKGATLRHYRLQDDSPQSTYTQNTHVRVEEGGNYDAFTMTKGAGFSRNQIHVELLGEESVCHLNGVNMLRGTQLGDTTITIEHKAPNCNSNQNYRTVLDGQATGVFQGKVHVHKPAQQTDGYQMSNALVLSDSAQMNTKPELEIYADDVKCSHGALTGKLDDTPMFYLRSRGIPEEQARQLLIQAFVNEIVDDLESDQFKTLCYQHIETWLNNVKSSG